MLKRRLAEVSAALDLEEEARRLAAEEAASRCARVCARVCMCACAGLVVFCFGRSMISRVFFVACLGVLLAGGMSTHTSGCVAPCSPCNPPHTRRVAAKEAAEATAARLQAENATLMGRLMDVQARAAGRGVGGFPQNRAHTLTHAHTHTHTLHTQTRTHTHTHRGPQTSAGGPGGEA